MKIKKKIQVDDYEFETDFNSDCGGGGFTWICPDCEEKIAWAPYHWWRLECSCRDWDFNVKMTGYKKEDE